MNTQLRVTADFFPGLDGILNHPRLSNAEKVIAMGYCKMLNPWRKVPENDTSYHKIAQITGTPYDTVKKLAPKVMTKLPEYFMKSPRQYGKSFSYIFKMSAGFEIKTDTAEPVNTQTDFIGDEDLQKVQILQKLGNFPRAWIDPLLKYSLFEIKVRTEYLLETMAKKGIGKNQKHTKLHFNYIKQCFDEQWSFSKLRDMPKKEKTELARAYDAGTNAMLDGIVEKFGFEKGAA